MADPRADAAIGTGDDIFLADDLGVTHQAIGDRPWMFDEIAVVADDAGHEHLAIRQLHLFPDAPLMIVAGIGRLDGIGARFNFENQIGDVLERHVVFVRPVVAAPAHVKTNALFG